MDEIQESTRVYPWVWKTMYALMNDPAAREETLGRLDAARLKTTSPMADQEFRIARVMVAKAKEVGSYADLDSTCMSVIEELYEKELLDEDVAVRCNESLLDIDIATECNELTTESFAPYSSMHGIFPERYDGNLFDFTEAVRQRPEVGMITLEYLEAAADRKYRTTRNVEQDLDDDDGRVLGKRRGGKRKRLFYDDDDSGLDDIVSMVERVNIVETEDVLTIAGSNGGASKDDIRLAVVNVVVEMSSAGLLCDEYVWTELKKRRIDFELIYRDPNLPADFDTDFEGWESVFFKQVLCPPIAVGMPPIPVGTPPYSSRDAPYSSRDALL